MREEYEIIDLSSKLLPLNAVKMKSRGARLVQICAVNTEEGYDLLYSFAEGYRFMTYKVPLGADEEIVSISDIYPSASLYENEMRELFGVRVRHMKLNYRDKLYTIEAVTPFKPQQKPKVNTASPQKPETGHADAADGKEKDVTNKEVKNG